MKELSSGADEVLLQLFLHGPTFDGDVCTKSGRDELVDAGLAERYEGYQWLTLDGIKLALERGHDAEKDRRRNQVNESGDMETMRAIIRRIIDEPIALGRP